jgi:prophage regulatory protein
MPDGDASDRILRKPAVLAIVGMSYTTIWRRYRSGDFPRPIRLSPGCVGWRESEITRWLAARPAVRP